MSLVNEMIEERYKDFISDEGKEINVKYFETLYEKYLKDEKNSLILNGPEHDSNVYAYPNAPKKLKSFVCVVFYEELKEAKSEVLENVHLCLCKMHAGLGSSVNRDDLLKKYSTRESLGAKGTDLFIPYKNKMLSIAEVQLIQAVKKSEHYKTLSYVNLVNEETSSAVKAIWKNYHPDLNKDYHALFNTNKLKAKEEICQLKMPTINDKGKLTYDRAAPAGHGFLGFYEIYKLFCGDDSSDEIMAIGNGEDLKSSPDEKMISWVAENNIPIVMITTTKLEKDKKGGQLAIVDGENPYVTIVEKAQAEKANQLAYFEALGLKKGDDISLFNTNIVLINKKALKKELTKLKSLSKDEFAKILAPDLIKNTKKQDQRDFIQLEGAIGSVMLNLDRYFRSTVGGPLVSFLNLAPESREKFFLPIKKREDFNEIYGNH